MISFYPNQSAENFRFNATLNLIKLASRHPQNCGDAQFWHKHWFMVSYFGRRSLIPQIRVDRSVFKISAFSGWFHFPGIWMIERFLSIFWLKCEGSSTQLRVSVLDFQKGKTVGNDLTESDSKQNYFPSLSSRLKKDMDQWNGLQSFSFVRPVSAYSGFLMGRG